MTVWPYVAAYILMWVAMISIAAALWLEMRSEKRRRRLVRDIESVIGDQNFSRTADDYYKRVA